MNRITLKLQINLNERNISNFQKNFLLEIKVIRKDDRFNVMPKTKKYNSIVYTSSNGFIITTNSIEIDGVLGQNFFTLPNNLHLQKPIIKCFITDNERKKYLKKLYESLLDWSTECNVFKKDNVKIRFRTINNNWYIYKIGV